MIEFNQFISTENVVIGYCKSNELQNIKIRWSLPIYNYGKRPSYYLKKHKTVIVIGTFVRKEDDIYRRSIFGSKLGDDYPGYKKSNLVARSIKEYLIKQGFKASIASGISFKNAAVLAGLGVWGKNGLVISKKYGSYLRFSCVITDWVPDQYGSPMEENLCQNCDLCISSCPHRCLKEYTVNAKRCFCKYLKRGQLSMEIPMCGICQEVCPYNNFSKESSN